MFTLLLAAASFAPASDDLEARAALALALASAQVARDSAPARRMPAGPKGEPAPEAPTFDFNPSCPDGRCPNQSFPQPQQATQTPAFTVRPTRRSRP